MGSEMCIRDSGRPCGSFTFEVDADLPYRYGGVSGDRPLHSLNERAAQSEGFPRKILQGMCTFAMCGSAVVAELAAGRPERLRRLAGRFASPVLTGGQLVVEFYDAGTSPEGDRIVAFEATSAGATVVKHGRAEIAGS